MISDGESLTALCFESSKALRQTELDKLEFVEPSFLPVFTETERWLDKYFCGEKPSFTPRIFLSEGSPFFSEVIKEVKKIPYGKTVTYGDIAKEIEKKSGRKSSARAVGSAVVKNPVCIIIPCHRVVAANNFIGGYSGGLNNKIYLLKKEKIENIRL